MLLLSLIIIKIFIIIICLSQNCPNEWNECASEGNDCDIPSTISEGFVSYGANGRFNLVPFTNNDINYSTLKIECDNDHGDIYYGTIKYCCYSPQLPIGINMAGSPTGNLNEGDEATEKTMDSHLNRQTDNV